MLDVGGEKNSADYESAREQGLNKHQRVPINTKYNPKASGQIKILYAKLIIHVNAENPDFIVLTESWINARDKPQVVEVSLNGYNVFEKCRTHQMEVFYFMQKIV